MHPPSPVRTWLAMILTILALPACGDDTGVFPGHDGGSGTGIVVVNSDYSSSSVSFLDRDGNLLMDGCLNYGSGSPGL